jgi:hypothetical protein
MTRFMTVFGWLVIVIGFGLRFCGWFSCALGFSRISPKTIFWLLGFSPRFTFDSPKKA